MKKSNIKILIAFIVLILLLFSTIFALLNRTKDTAVKGVKIDGIDISGLTREQAKDLIGKKYGENKKSEIQLKYNDYETTINTDALEASYDIDNAVNTAIFLGRGGNIFKDNYDIILALLGKKNVQVEFSMNEDQAKKEIENIQTNMPGVMEEPEYYIEGEELIIVPGKQGIKIDEDSLLNKIKDYFKNDTSSSDYIDIPVVEAWPSQIDIDKIHQDVYKEVQDASITQNPTTVHLEVEGVDFDVDQAKQILSEQKDKYEIPLKITKPNVTIMQLSAEAFPDKLTTYSTRYDGGDTNRATNLELACKKINNKVVLPGETFSYNTTVGPRTASAGFKNAKVYENGAVVDGIGGGICQISTTLYNAVLRANMEIVERRNHQFITSYVPEGLDATVVYGVTDFKFKNNRKYAVQIKATASNGVATIDLYGIKEDPEYLISFESKKISVIPYTTKEVEDSSLAPGEKVVKQPGANGSVVETYIVKSLNGKVAEKSLLSRDTYNPLQKVVLVGK